MSKKYQELKRTSASNILSIINYLIIEIENSYDDNYNLFDAMIESNTIDLNYLSKKINNENLIEFKIDVPWDFEYSENEIVGKKIIIKNEKDPKNKISLRYLYDFIPYIPYKLDLDIIKHFSSRTTMSNIEYLFLYDYNGNLSVLEGEWLKVRIPFVKVIYNMHTHPNGHCGFSSPDINSGLDLLSEGGLASSVSTDSCALVMYRQGLITEDDYLKIKSEKYNEKFDSIKFIKIVY